MQSPYNYNHWRRYIPDIDRVIRDIDATNIISIGITPFTRIVPGFFLNNYAIYTIKHSGDVDVMKEQVRMHVLEDHNKGLARKVQGTGYLTGNYIFQAFLKKLPQPMKVMFYTMTDKIMDDMEKMGIGWIGNPPKTAENVVLKSDFRKLLEDRDLPRIDYFELQRERFLELSYKDITAMWNKSVVIQRGDKETGGNLGTFFVHNKRDFKECLSVLREDEFGKVIISPFIKGHTTSMLGCATQKGVLTGPMQLQLIDVPESLHGVPANGIFFGNDIGFKDWSDEVEKEAQKVVESIGAHLYKKGYRGIFGIDFIYDKETQKLYPIECNPRFTGSLVLYSLSLLDQGIPPMELFHLMSHLNIESEYDFNTVNTALKTRSNCSHIAFSPQNIDRMNVPLKAGVYEYKPKTNDLDYVGPGLSLNDLKNENQFLLADTVPALGAEIAQGVPRLFKFIFKRSIAVSSQSIEKDAGFLVERFAKALLGGKK